MFCVGMNEREILKKVLSPESQQKLKKKKRVRQQKAENFFECIRVS